MENIYNTTWDVTYPLSKPKGKSEPLTIRRTVENISVKGDITKASSNLMYRKRVVGWLHVPKSIEDYVIEKMKVNSVKIKCEL